MAGGARGPFRLAIAALIAAILTISLGGMTTSTVSGMAFLDWPLANGSLWPENMTLAGYFEHLHRAAATVTGLLSIAIWWKTRRLPSWVRWAAASLILIVSTQGVLGGLGVLKHLPWFTSISHGVLAQATLAYLVVLCFVFSSAWGDRAEVDGGQRRSALKLAAWAVGCMSVAAPARRDRSAHGFDARRLGARRLCDGRGHRRRHRRCVHGPAASNPFPVCARQPVWSTGRSLVQLVLGFAALAVAHGQAP